MLALLRRHRIECKYLLLAGAVVGSLFLLDRLDALSGFDTVVDQVMDWAATLGPLGVFVVALLANAAIVIQVPYTLPLLIAAVNGASTGEMLTLGLACGLGAALGKIISYQLAHRYLGGAPDLERSPLYRWVERNAEAKPRRTQLLVFVCTASPLPDDTVILPLAMIRFGLRRLWLPIVVGKVLHNLSVALVFLVATSWFAERVSGQVRTDVAFGALAMFVLLVLYQVEKARTRTAHSGVGAPEPVGTVVAAFRESPSKL